MRSLVKTTVSLVLVSLLTGCGFWGGKKDEVRPAPLVDFQTESQVQVVWSAQVGSGPGRAFHEMTPSIDADRIYAADSKGVVSGFDRMTGARAWTQNLKEPIIGGVGAGFGQVILSSRSGDVIALSGNDGSVLWRTAVGSEVTAQAQLNRELVVVQLVSGRIVALDRQTGALRWTFDAQMPALTLRGTGTPLLTSDVTFAGFANGKLIAISNANGAMIWEQRVSLAEGRSELERMADIDGRPLILNNVLYVVGYQGRLLAINPFNSQILWAQDISSHRGLATGFGNIYVAADNDRVHALDAATSASVWTQTGLDNRQLSTPSTLASAVVVADQEGYLHFMSQVDGRFVARYRVDSSGVRGDMLVRDDILYVLSNAGRLMALRLN
ncbi:outer membrane protein assembly factor BamB [Nitrincola tapanii]|uniref:Outer membrane protein assembly factor BamB n=1 Tax=Nitrincola tapanii TaxID=1708751 RepID=A0A5A9W765_9GAMM|nr:outer membrane protein assembly factor BamB [Nitrincola tapanii]KAA0876640.1 outer membrane protein assembly factor BamB [Nitrincola tapanii]